MLVLSFCTRSLQADVNDGTLFPYYDPHRFGHSCLVVASSAGCFPQGLETKVSEYGPPKTLKIDLRQLVPLSLWLFWPSGNFIHRFFFVKADNESVRIWTTPDSQNLTYINLFLLHVTMSEALLSSVTHFICPFVTS
jgi:hypothetical protein